MPMEAKIAIFTFVIWPLAFIVALIAAAFVSGDDL
jgi:hypothetical protein